MRGAGSGSQGRQGPAGPEGPEGPTGPAGPDSYAPGDAGDWTDPDPTTFTSATDRLADRGLFFSYALPGSVSLIAGASAFGKYYGPAADVIEVCAVINDDATLDGEAQLAPSLAGVPITDGTVVFAAGGVVEGDESTATPTAANAIADGDQISVTSGGANTVACTATIVLKLRARA